MRRYSRATIDRWIRAWRRGGLEALRPETRSDTGAVRAHPELADEAAALRLELPTRSAAQISRILYARHGIRVAERTVRDQLPAEDLHREALAAEPKAFGRYEADRAEREVDHRRAGRALGPASEDAVLCAGQALFDRRRPFAACWSTAASSPTRTPGRAKTRCARRSCAAAFPRFCMPTTGRRSPMPGSQGPVRCSGSASCTRCPIRLKAGASKSGSTASSERRSWKRPAIRGSTLSPRWTTCSLPGPSRWPTAGVHAETKESPIDRF